MPSLTNTNLDGVLKDALTSVLGYTPADINTQPSTLVQIWGQSNALGVGISSELKELSFLDDLTETLDRVYIYDPYTTAFVKMKIGVNNVAAWDSRYSGVAPGASCFGPELGIAYRWLQENPVGNLYIQKEVVNGGPIAAFAKGTAFYTSAMNNKTVVNALLAAGNVAANRNVFLWVQGEGDSGASQASYSSAMTALFSNLTSDGCITPATKILMAQIPTTSSGYGNGPAAAKTAYAAGNPNSLIIGYPTAFNSDNLHLNALGQIGLGFDAFWRGLGTTKKIPRVTVAANFTGGSIISAKALPSAILMCLQYITKTT